MVRLARALEAEVAVHLVPGEETAAKVPKEGALAVADNVSGHAYGRVRKKGARG